MAREYIKRFSFYDDEYSRNYLDRNRARTSPLGILLSQLRYFGRNIVFPQRLRLRVLYIVSRAGECVGCSKISSWRGSQFVGSQIVGSQIVGSQTVGSQIAGSTTIGSQSPDCRSASVGPKFLKQRLRFRLLYMFP